MGTIIVIQKGETLVGIKNAVVNNAVRYGTMRALNLAATFDSVDRDIFRFRIWTQVRPASTASKKQVKSKVI